MDVPIPDTMFFILRIIFLGAFGLLAVFFLLRAIDSFLAKLIVASFDTYQQYLGGRDD